MEEGRGPVSPLNHLRGGEDWTMGSVDEFADEHDSGGGLREQRLEV